VGLVFGGRSVEHRVSVSSARTVAAGLRQAGHEVVGLGIAPDGCWVPRQAAEAALAGEIDAFEPLGTAVEESLSHLLEARVEVVFPVVHGTWGEDGTLQGLCEMLDLAYVGADVTASAIAMDKLQCKRLLSASGIAVVDFEAVTATEMREAADALRRLERLPLPLFVKPSCGGSSVGVRRVDAREEVEAAVRFALRFDDAVVVEEGVVGRELECSVLGDETLEASVIGEVVPGNEFYDYEDKYLQDEAGLEMPAQLSAETAAEIRSTAVEAFAAIGGSGMARVDFLMADDGTLYVNEINTLPGFTRISMYPKLWDLSGLPLDRLVDRLVDIGRRRHERRRQLDDGIKNWLAAIDA
jgi:D-alanine-D-alanine ligase